jgi:hypothetical protein
LELVSYSEATKRSPMDGSVQDLCIPLQPPLSYIKQPKMLFASEGYHLFTSTRLPVNRIPRRQEENTGKYTGGVSVRARRTYREV